jgi:SAM-dependent methyltransferase
MVDLVKFLKEAAKSHPALYRIVFLVFSPVFIYPGRDMFSLLKKRGVRPGPDDVVFNLGSGAQDFRVKGFKVYNLDLVRYKPVKVVGDVCHLPIKTGSLLAAMSYVVLEHIGDLEGTLSEMERVVRPGGFIYIAIPFLQPFHSCPGDRLRWTHEGAASLYESSSLELVERGVLGGPTSALLWTFQAWVSVLTSMGIKPLRDLIYLAVSAITFPIKWLDILFWFKPLAKECASVHYVLFRKRIT